MKTKKTWLDLSLEEKAAFEPKRLIWKSEGPGIGPIWLESDKEEWDDFWKRNQKMSVKYSGRWFEYQKAEELARGLKLELHTC